MVIFRFYIIPGDVSAGDTNSIWFVDTMLYYISVAAISVSSHPYFGRKDDEDTM